MVRIFVFAVLDAAISILREPVGDVEYVSPSRITVRGKPRRLLMDMGDEWENDVWANQRSARHICHKF